MSAVQDDLTDEMLMVRYQRGERDAFAELVRRHSRPVYNFFLRQLQQPAKAQASTRETFRKLVQNAAEFKHEGQFASFLYAIARSLSLGAADSPPTDTSPSKTRQSSSTSLPVPPEQDSENSASDPSQVKDPLARSPGLETAVTQAVDRLPAEQREVYLLRELAGLPFSEIAEITSTDEATVRNRMRYALDRLRQAIRGLEEYARALR